MAAAAAQNARTASAASSVSRRLQADRSGDAFTSGPVLSIDGEAEDLRQAAQGQGYRGPRDLGFPPENGDIVAARGSAAPRRRCIAHSLIVSEGAMNATLDLLRSRRSVAPHLLGGPGPTAEELEALLTI